MSAAIELTDVDYTCCSTLFVIGYLLLVICYWLFVTGYLLVPMPDALCPMPYAQFEL